MQQTPSLVLNNDGSRQQVPLRDYLNTRLAPFLKKAITQSLDSEAEFPLQWLGECLINQSILYEGNEDAKKLKDGFKYNFDAPKIEEQPQTEQPQTSTETNGVSAPPVPAEGGNGAPVNGTEAVQGELRMTEQAAEAQAPTAGGDTEMGGTA